MSCFQDGETNLAVIRLLKSRYSKIASGMCWNPWSNTSIAKGVSLGLNRLWLGSSPISELAAMVRTETKTNTIQGNVLITEINHWIIVRIQDLIYQSFNTFIKFWFSEPLWWLIHRMLPSFDHCVFSHFMQNSICLNTHVLWQLAKCFYSASSY